MIIAGEGEIKIKEVSIGGKTTALKRGINRHEYSTGNKTIKVNEFIDIFGICEGKHGTKVKVELIDRPSNKKILSAEHQIPETGELRFHHEIETKD